VALPAQQAAATGRGKRTRDAAKRRYFGPIRSKSAENMVMRQPGFKMGAHALNPVLWYILWFALALALLCVVITMFLQDMARFNRREPLRIPFIGEAHPGDLTYPLALMELFGPYVTLGVAITFFLGLSVYLAVFAG
jgi:hypothetical protein